MYHQEFSHNSQNMGFKQWKVDYDLRTIDCTNNYEYIAVMVDDILVFSKDPESRIEPIKDINGYELQGFGIPEYYSGADIVYDKSRQCWTVSAKTYIKMFAAKLKNYLMYT